MSVQSAGGLHGGDRGEGARLGRMDGATIFMCPKQRGHSSTSKDQTRRISSAILLNHFERDFPPRVAGLDELQGATRFGQGENRVHHGF